MPQYFHRLENALKRANEFIDVGKKVEALMILCDVLRSRKHRTWQKYHEDIMMKYLELCVELRKSYVAKEGIYQYKIICQQTQIKSFEDVVRRYLELAEAKAEAARAEAQAAVVEVDDLDNLETPENILLSAVSNEVSQDRTDRVVLLPWVKFLWESYRQSLELLRNYARTEKLYHDIAHKAFQFCIRFNRKTEFRKLCDNLHTHLEHIKKQMQFPIQSHASSTHVSLANVESVALHLETRLLQLDCAITMELWQEAYKATDDIKRYGLMNLQRKASIKPALLAGYYHKLALVFQKANCPIFHAAALLRHFILQKEYKAKMKEDETQRMASRVVAATLSMPIPPTRPEIDKLVDTEENVIENHHRNLASLLGLSAVVPNRSSLIRDLKRMTILNYAAPELQQLYQWLEVDFDPLVLCKKIENVVAFMEKNDDLQVYVPALKEVTIVRLLKEVAQVYSSIEMKRLLELCPYADPITLETIVVNAARRNDIQIRIDHRKQCLHFGGAFMSQADEIPEGPFLQSMPSSQMRQQLVYVYSVLQKARSIIEKDQIKQKRDVIKQKIMLEYERRKDNERFDILARQEYIEDRKERLEQEALRREEEHRREIENQQKKLRLQEDEKIKKELEEREKLREEQERVELKRRMASDAIESLKQTEAGKKILETLDESELAELRADDIRIRQYELLEKERKEQISRQQKLEKKVDHLERAKRIEEIPLLDAQYEKEKVKDRQIFEEMEKQRIEELIAERNLALQHRDRLLGMKDTATAFAEEIRQARSQEYQAKLKEWEQKIEILRREKLVERVRKRKEDRRNKYHKEKREAEEAKRKAEERARFEEEKVKREEQRRAMDELAKRQREREEEAERKAREREEQRIRQLDEARAAASGYNKPEEPQSWRGSMQPVARDIDKRDGPRAVPVREEPDDWRRKPPPQEPSPQHQPPRTENQPWRPRHQREDGPPIRRQEPVAHPETEEKNWRERPEEHHREIPPRDFGPRDGPRDDPRHRNFPRESDRDFRRSDAKGPDSRPDHQQRDNWRGQRDEPGPRGEPRRDQRGYDDRGGRDHRPRDDDQNWRRGGGGRQDDPGHQQRQAPSRFDALRSDDRGPRDGPPKDRQPRPQPVGGESDGDWQTINRRR